MLPLVLDSWFVIAAKHSSPRLLYLEGEGYQDDQVEQKLSPFSKSDPLIQILSVSRWLLNQQIQKLWNYIFIGSLTMFSILMRSHLNQKDISPIPSTPTTVDPGRNGRILWQIVYGKGDVGVTDPITR
jgi:hypothetical protein